MPRKSQKPCCKPGCGRLTRERFCDKHSNYANEVRRPFRKRGYSAAWDKLSKRWRRYHPLCKHCQDAGRVSVAELVDHIVPVHIAPERVLDETNLQSLCRSCHLKKTESDKQAYGVAG